MNTAASQGDYIAAHTFGQKKHDKELEAYYSVFRYYDADTMRFTVYAYTRNNPVTLSRRSPLRRGNPSASSNLLVTQGDILITRLRSFVSCAALTH